MVTIDAAAWNSILRHARAASPAECCGILLGAEPEPSARLVAEAVPCRNVYPGDRTRRFLIDPEEHLATQRGARERGLLVLGYYHSHPASAARLSADDLAEAHPWVSNLIVALREGEFFEARCYRVDAERRICEESLGLPSAFVSPAASPIK